MIDKIGILSRISLFENLPPAQIEAVAEISENHMVKKKEQLFQGGAPGDRVYILVQGAIQLYNISREGKEVVIKVVKPGEMFGEVVLFERDTYPAYATVLKNSQLFSFKKSDFLHLLDEPAFRAAFISQIMKKMRYLTEQVHHIATLDVVDRLFLFFKEHHGDARSFNVGLSKKDIAAAIGTTQETLSRTIRKLAECGAISWEGKQVELRQTEKCEECRRNLGSK